MDWVRPGFRIEPLRGSGSRRFSKPRISSGAIGIPSLRDGQSSPLLSESDVSYLSTTSATCIDLESNLAQATEKDRQTSARSYENGCVASRPRNQTESQRRLYSKVQFVSLGIVNSKPSMNKLSFYTANVHGRSQQPDFRNLSIRILTNWRGFWSCAQYSCLGNCALG